MGIRDWLDRAKDRRAERDDAWDTYALFIPAPRASSEFAPTPGRHRRDVDADPDSPSAQTTVKLSK